MKQSQSEDIGKTKVDLKLVNLFLIYLKIKNKTGIALTILCFG